MKKKTGIVLSVLTLAFALYFSITSLLTHEVRCAYEAECPELQWLKAEYDLSDEQFQKISELHNSHELHCGHICHDLKKSRDKLIELGNSHSGKSKAFERTLSEWRDVRDRSQDLIIDHMFQVSSEMDDIQGRKYREHVFYNIITPERQPHSNHRGRLNVEFTTSVKTTASN